MASSASPDKQPELTHTYGLFPAKRTRTQPKEAKETITELNNYQKKRILSYLKQHGCTKEEFTRVVRKLKNKKATYDQLTKCIVEAENNVHEECESLSFNNINEWLQLLKETKFNEHCYYEAAVVINAIACNEPQPTLEELGGVNLKEIYTFLGKALLGQPQQQLSTASAQFLSQEFESLIEEANSTAGDEAAQTIKRELNENAKNAKAYDFSTQPQNKCSMDPFSLDHKID